MHLEPWLQGTRKVPQKQTSRASVMTERPREGQRAEIGKQSLITEQNRNRATDFTDRKTQRRAQNRAKPAGGRRI